MESNAGVTVLVLKTRQKVRAIGDVGELAAAMREQQVLRVEDPGDGRVKYVPSHLIAWVEEEPIEGRGS